MREDRNFFRTLFIGLTVMVVISIGVAMAALVFAAKEDPFFPKFMLILFPSIFVFIGLIFGAIGVFVYRDAASRGLNAWMWVTIVVFVPNLLGLIIYLIMRGNHTKACLNCGKPVSPEFNNCPFCGSSQRSACPGCGHGVSPEWKVCPHCKHELEGGV